MKHIEVEYFENTYEDFLRIYDGLKNSGININDVAYDTGRGHFFVMDEVALPPAEEIKNRLSSQGLTVDSVLIKSMKGTP